MATLELVLICPCFDGHKPHQFSDVDKVVAAPSYALSMPQNTGQTCIKNVRTLGRWQAVDHFMLAHLLKPHTKPLRRQ